MTKSPNDAFLRTFSIFKRSTTVCAFSLVKENELIKMEGVRNFKKITQIKRLTSCNNQS